MEWSVGAISRQNGGALQSRDFLLPNCMQCNRWPVIVMLYANWHILWKLIKCNTVSLPCSLCIILGFLFLCRFSVCSSSPIGVCLSFPKTREREREISLYFHLQSSSFKGGFQIRFYLSRKSEPNLNNSCTFSKEVLKRT